MYHENKLINDIVTTVIADGDGSQCGGFGYNDRVYFTMQQILTKTEDDQSNSNIYAKDVLAWLRKKNHYIMENDFYNGEYVWFIAGGIINQYYIEHVKEILST